MAAVFAAFPHLGPVLPAMGYDSAQRAALAETIARSEAELVVSGTPAALEGLAKPVIRARYAFEEAQEPGLGALVDGFVARLPR